MRNYNRVLFVRNPNARLYSARSNKFRDMPKTCYEDQYGRHCDPHYRNWRNLAEKLLVSQGGSRETLSDDPQVLLASITWPMFLKGVLDGVIVDRHWIMQVCTCECAQLRLGADHNGFGCGADSVEVEGSRDA